MGKNLIGLKLQLECFRPDNSKGFPGVRGVKHSCRRLSLEAGQTNGEEGPLWCNPDWMVEEEEMGGCPASSVTLTEPRGDTSIFMVVGSSLFSSVRFFNELIKLYPISCPSNGKGSVWGRNY